MKDNRQPLAQGDVLLIPVDAVPEGATVVPRDHGRVVLAYGEVTGHAHAIVAPEAEATLLTTEQNERFLRLVSPQVLVHEEHGPIGVGPGTWRVTPQREYAYGEAEQRVAD